MRNARNIAEVVGQVLPFDAAVKQGFNGERDRPAPRQAVGISGKDCAFVALESDAERLALVVERDLRKGAGALRDRENIAHESERVDVDVLRRCETVSHGARPQRRNPYPRGYIARR